MAKKNFFTTTERKKTRAIIIRSIQWHINSMKVLQLHIITLKNATDFFFALSFQTLFELACAPLESVAVQIKAKGTTCGQMVKYSSANQWVKDLRKFVVY